jgi:CHRD domain
MKKLALAVAIVSLGAVALIATAIAKNGSGGNGGRTFHAKLTGYEEVLAVSTRGHGTFRARLKSATELEYRLTYRDLEGAMTPGTGGSGQAHIHFGQPSTNGGVSAFLCGGSPPASDKPACPTTNPGTVTGVIDTQDVIGPSGQGIAAGEFAELIRAMRNGATYANVHTTLWPNGEIRGQIDRGHHFGFFRGKHKGKRGGGDD